MFLNNVVGNGYTLNALKMPFINGDANTNFNVDVSVVSTYKINYLKNFYCFLIPTKD